MRVWRALCVLSIAVTFAGPALAGDLQTLQERDYTSANEDWAVYNGNAGGTHYSDLDQITIENVSQLHVAWSYDSGDAFGKGVAQSDMQSNPLIIDGRLVFVSPKGRIICLNAETGKELWLYDPADGRDIYTRQRSRGVTYWTDGTEERILFTFRQHLMALDMRSGRLIKSFGKDGRVDLRQGLGRDPASLSVTSVTPGAIFEDLIIFGSTGLTPGHIRAFDVKTGKIVWTFHTIPQPGEAGYETWPKDAWKRSFGANAWAGLTVDPEEGLVFVPTASGGMAQKDFYGADRHGRNLFANSLLALDARTGKLVWYFQAVRHDLWDRDFPTQPVLVNVKRNGQIIPAVAQATKSGHVFVFNRETGESLFPLKEIDVPSSDMPGEKASPVQVLPERPAPFSRQQLTEENLTRRTPAAHKAVLQEFAKYSSRGQFDPPSLDGTIILPGLDGGAEWGGGAFDPQTGVYYVNANEMAWVLKLSPRPAVSGTSGKAVYVSQCSSCHGIDRKGSPPEFPSLVDVGDRMPKIEIMIMLVTGGGRMPPFRQLPPSQLDAVTDYIVTGRDIGGGDDEGQADGAHQTGDGYIFDGYNRFLDPDGYPAIAPPWGTLSAIDLSSGEYRWQIPLGEYPELAAQGMTDTGSENYGGPVVTAGGVLFIGATVYDNKFRAFDKRSGNLLWETTLPTAGNSTPSTYMVNGQQFVVICAGGSKNLKGEPGGSIVAFALPRGSK